MEEVEDLLLIGRGFVVRGLPEVLQSFDFWSFDSRAFLRGSDGFV
jgi:hypothetical protein